MVDHSDHRGELVSKAGRRRHELEFVQSVFESFEHAERLVEIQNEPERDRIIRFVGHGSSRWRGLIEPNIESRTDSYAVSGPPSVLRRSSAG